MRGAPRDTRIDYTRDRRIIPGSVERADARKADLDGDGSPEWVLKVVLVSDQPGMKHRRFMAQVFRLAANGDGYIHHYPFRSEYTTSFWVLEGGQLIHAFGPFVTFAEGHGNEWHQQTTGTVRLRSKGWPKLIVTRTTRCEDVDDAWSCEAAERTRWRWQGETYQPQ